MAEIGLFIKKVYRFLFPSPRVIYLRKLEKELRDVESVLDLGCGENSPLREIKKVFFSVGVDIWEESIKKSKELKIHDEYMHMNVLDIDKVFPPKSFDVVLALDLIEHLTKEEGKLLIEKAEKIARKKVIIVTPNGFVKQKVIGNNIFQEHKSGWNYFEMKKLGYKCVGMNGIKFIKREGGRIVLKPRILWSIIADISQKFVYYMPFLAYHLFCVKNL